MTINDGGGNGADIIVNPATGLVVSGPSYYGANPFTAASATIGDIDAYGYRRIAITATTSAAIALIYAVFQLAAGTTLNYSGDGLSGFDLWGAQLTEGSALGPYVPTDGTAAYGYGRPGITFDGFDDELTLALQPFPSGAAPCEIWILSDQTTSATDGTTRRAFAYGGGSNDSREMIKTVVSGVNRAQAAIGDGVTRVFPTNTGVDLSGRHVTRALIGPTLARADVDSQAGTESAVVPATASARTRIGATATPTAAGFWSGIHNSILVTSPLTEAEAAQLTAYLKARGGIA
jgi:hypothetical protein